MKRLKSGSEYNATTTKHRKPKPIQPVIHNNPMSSEECDDNDISIEEDGKSVHLRSFNMDDYVLVDVYIPLQAIGVHSVHPSDAQINDPLIQSMQQCGYDPTRGHIKVTHSMQTSQVISETDRATFHSWEHIIKAITERTDCGTLTVKSSSPLTFIVVDGSRRVSFLKEKNVDELIRVIWILRKTGEHLCSWERFVLSVRINSAPTGRKILQTSNCWISVVQYVMLFSTIFKHQYGISMAEARVTDIASELKTLQLLKTERISSYWRYARVGRMLVNFPSVWRLLLQTYCIDNNYSQAQTKRTQRGISTSGIGLTHIDDPRLRQASEEDALLMVKCLIHHVQCDRRYYKLGITAITRLTFNAKEFYINASNILNMLHLVHDQSTINTIKRGGFDTFILRRISYIRKGAHVHTNIMSELLSLTSLRYRPSSSSPINSDVCAEAIEMLKQRIVTSAKKNPLRLRIRKDNVVQALGNIRLPTKHVNSRIQLRVPLRYTGRTASNFHNVRGTSHSNYSDSNHHSQSIDEYVPNYVQKHISLNDNNISLHDKVSLHISTPHVPTQADINPLMEQRKGRREEHSSLTDIAEVGLFDDRVTENIPFGAHEFPPSDLNICVSDQNRCTRTSNKPICMACTDMTWRPWLTGRSTTLKGAENLDRELLNSLSIPSSHRGNVFLNNDCLDYMRHSAWYSAARALWDECGITNPITKLHLKEREDHGCVITSAAGYYFSGKKSELFNRGYCILTGLADHDHHNIRQREFNTCTCATCHFNAPNMWPSYSLDDLYKWVYGTFLDYFVDSGKMKLWTSIINTGDKDVDAIHRQEGKARYISTTSLVVDKMENKVHVWTAVRRAFLDTWVCMLLTMMDITERGMYSLSVPASGGRFLITGREAVEQVGHNDFIPKEGKSPGFFAIVTGKEAAVIYVCPGSHLYIHYSVNSLRELAKTLEMVPIDIPAYSIFVAHGAVQHAGAGWNGSHSMRYHLYLVPNGYQLPDGVHFAYDAALKCTSSRPTVSLPT